MVSALAPWSVAFTEMVGKSTLGNGATGRNGNEPHKSDRRHRQRGGDRPLNEGLGNVHDGYSRLATADVGPVVCACAGIVTCTFEFCCSLYWPSTTTRSPLARPEVMIV